MLYTIKLNLKTNKITNQCWWLGIRDSVHSVDGTALQYINIGLTVLYRHTRSLSI